MDYNNYEFANYTITIKDLIENGANIFNFGYAVNVDSKELERRFINKYYFREIGYETYSMWHFKFKEQWINRIKHYNLIFDKYKDIDPLLDYKEVTEYISNELSKNKENTKGTSDNQSTGDTDSKSNQKQKDTPITAYDDSDFVSFIADDTNKTISTASATSSSEVDMLRDIVKDMNSNSVKTIMSDSQLKRLNDYVNGYMDVMERFVSEFNNLFMNIY